MCPFLTVSLSVSPPLTQCITGSRVGFWLELAATLLAPTAMGDTGRAEALRAVRESALWGYQVRRLVASACFERADERRG